MVFDNFLPKQYDSTRVLPVNHCYLREQFSDYKDIFQDIEQLILREDFTLGRAVDAFEEQFAALTGTRFAVGVGSGTDALFLSLRLLNLKEGDEVITTPYTFFATIGAIATAGGKPVFVDVRDDYNIDPELIEKAITKRTKAILPVHWAGLPCEMPRILEIADKHGLPVIEDACHAIKAHHGGKPAGSFGFTGCFSMHPLKNLNVWGDGGVVVTNSEKVREQLFLLRNHGLRGRDISEVYGFNSRLDTIQAIVANHLIKKLDHITESRIERASYLDKGLSEIPQIRIPSRPKHVKQVYHLYVIRAENRDGLIQHLVSKGIDAKVHYPIPMHLQPAAQSLGYKKGDFPQCEAICNSILSLPVHEFVRFEQLQDVIQSIREFYS